MASATSPQTERQPLLEPAPGLSKSGNNQSSPGSASIHPPPGVRPHSYHHHPGGSSDKLDDDSTSNAPKRPPYAPRDDSTNIKVTVKNVDMEAEQQELAIALAKEGMLNDFTLREIAGRVKRAFDAKYGTTWHCVVGKNYGSYCTHETRGFIFFYADSLAFMLFKTT